MTTQRLPKSSFAGRGSLGLPLGLNDAMRAIVKRLERGHELNLERQASIFPDGMAPGITSDPNGQP